MLRTCLLAGARAPADLRARPPAGPLMQQRLAEQRSSAAAPAAAALSSATLTLRGRVPCTSYSNFLSPMGLLKIGLGILLAWRFTKFM